MTKQIPLLVRVSGSTLTEPLPNGKYALITYDSAHIKTTRGTSLGNVMPWSIVIYESDSNLCVSLTSSSIPNKLLTEHDVLKVIAVGLNQEQITELVDKLGSHNIKLLQEERV